jgi:hypothetical protein
MKPVLSPAHGAGLGTTAGITAVIAVVAAVSMLGQCRNVHGLAAMLGAAAVACFILGAGALYTGRNLTGQALDLAATDPAASGISAARGLFYFHLGMTGMFGGGGFAAWFSFYPLDNAMTLLASLAGFAMAAVALGNAGGWARELRRRRTGEMTGAGADALD